MNNKFKLFIYLLLMLKMLAVNAIQQPPVWFKNVGGEVKLNVELFLSTTCTHCQKAKIFFQDLEKKDPQLSLQFYYIDQDKSALQTFYERLTAQNTANFAIPSFFFCDTHWFGFANAESTGHSLLQAMNYCRQQIIKRGDLTKPTVDVLRQWSMANPVQIPLIVEKSPVKLIPLMALADAANVCSLFCLMAFFAFIWLSPQRKWQQFTTGAIFILSLVLINYITQSHPTFTYQVIIGLRWPAAIIGGLLVWYSLYSFNKVIHHQSLQQAPLIFFLITITAVIIQVYQQTCSLNVALVFQQWLANQSVSYSKQVLYQLCYQLIYLIPLSLILTVNLLLNHHTRLRSKQNKLRISSVFILLAIGCLLIVYPYLLNNFWLSLLVLILSVLVGWLFARRYE